MASALKRLHDSHRTLRGLGIPHGLIGAWAVIAWGRVRATRDVDWLAEIPPSRLKAVMAAFAALGAPEWRPPGQDDPIAGLIRVVPSAEDEPVVDILLASKAADRAALARCAEVVIGSGPLPAVRREDIIAMKLQSGGGMDIDDARALLQNPAVQFDEELLHEACAARRVTRLLKDIRGEPV